MLRQISVLSLAALLAIATHSASHAADQINWATSLEEARTLAAQQNKLLLIHFWTPDCGPCKVIDKKVFPIPGVVQAMHRNYVPLKVNAYQDTTLRDFFGVTRWPTDVVATIDGKAVHEMVTASSPTRYVQQLTAIAMQHRPTTELATNTQSAQPRNVPTAGPAQSQLSQTASGYRSTPNNTPQWSNKIASPDLTDNSARARRPGIDPRDRAGYEPPLGGPMMPRIQTQHAQPQSGTASMSAQGNRFTNSNRLATGGTPGKYSGGSTPQASQPQGITNRFAGNSRFSNNNMPPTTARSTSVAQSAITNPYATGPQQPASSNVATRQPLATQQSLAQQSPVIPPSEQLAQHLPSNTNAEFQAPTHQPPGNSDRPVQPSSPTPNVMAAQTSPTAGVATQNSAPAVASRPDPSVSPESTVAPMGLDGRCPVTLITRRKWVKGDDQWGAVHRGYTYLFAGPQEQQQFLADPDGYSPMLAGMDVVALAQGGKVAQGNRRFGVLYDNDGNGPHENRIYLFESVVTRNQFESNPESFVEPVMQAMQQGRLESLLR